MFGNSAPLLVDVTMAKPEMVGVFVSEAGEVNQTMWTAGTELS